MSRRWTAAKTWISASRRRRTCCRSVACAWPRARATGVRAAWLAFPALELEPLEQVYAHLDGGRYRYESEGGFTADLETRSDGFVTRYGDLWFVETGA